MYNLFAVRDGVPYVQLTHINSEIHQDAAAAIKRVVRGTILEMPPEVDFLRDRLLVTDAADRPLGSYVVTTAPRTVTDAGVRTCAIEGYDLTYLVQRGRVETRQDAFWPAGTLYTDIVRQILVRCGIADIILTPSTAALAADRGDWEIGTSWLDVVNQLLDEIGYTSLWADASGNIRVQPYTAPENRDVDHDYGQGTLLRAHELQDDTFEAYNVWTVLVDSPDLDAPIWAQAVNDDPTSRLSTARRGRIPAPVTKLDGIADQAAAQAYADALKRRSMISTETARIETAAEAGHEMLDILSIDLPGLSGKWEEIGWTLPLSGPGLMQHTIRRAVYV